MSGAGGMDVRKPIGLMFLIVGLILIGYGVATGGDPMYAKSLSININLYWGVAMAVFGAVFVGFSFLGKK